MRQIKFKGKDDSGEWLYGSYIQQDSVIVLDEGGEIAVDPDTVGQFTGLTDKSGREIYEGNVLNNGQRNYFVCWNEERGAWWLKNKDLIYTQPLGSLSTELFVIGNVHDNPELPKGGKE